MHLKNDLLISELCSKPTDSYEYLNLTSCHPPQVTRNNPYLVALQGVGSCLVLLQRMPNCVTSIEKRKPGFKIEQHFTRQGHTTNDYSVLWIVKLKNPPRYPKDRLREFEGHWMIKLNMPEPYGLNGINEFERIIKKRGLRSSLTKRFQVNPKATTG